MTRWAPCWDDDLGPAPEGDHDPTPTPDGEGERPPTGAWSQQYRANRSHDCVRRSPYCPGEICPGEIYTRSAVLERPKGLDRRGTVTVTRACQTCQENPR